MTKKDKQDWQNAQDLTATKLVDVVDLGSVDD